MKKIAFILMVAAVALTACNGYTKFRAKPTGSDCTEIISVENGFVAGDTIIYGVRKYVLISKIEDK